MDDPDYAPQSPDLSAYHSSYPPDQPSSYYLQQQPYQSYNPSTATYNNQHYLANQFPSQSPTHILPDAMPRNGRMKQELDDAWNPKSSSRMGGSKAKKQTSVEQFDRPAPGVKEGIEVKTKFPVARIKRIMQADEDVGKVAQVTPTAVSKALELFMISIVTKAAEEAKARSSKRVTAAHLKQVVQKDEQFDFLGDIISKVPDAPAPKKDDDSEEMAEGKKKRGGTRRKRKHDDDL